MSKGRLRSQIRINFQKTSKRLFAPPALISENYVALFSGGAKLCNKFFWIGVTPPFFRKFVAFPPQKCSFIILKSATKFFGPEMTPPLWCFPQIFGLPGSGKRSEGWDLTRGYRNLAKQKSYIFWEKIVRRMERRPSVQLPCWQKQSNWEDARLGQIGTRQTPPPPHPPHPFQPHPINSARRHKHKPELHHSSSHSTTFLQVIVLIFWSSQICAQMDQHDKFSSIREVLEKIFGIG